MLQGVAKKKELEHLSSTQPGYSCQCDNKNKDIMSWGSDTKPNPRPTPVQLEKLQLLSCWWFKMFLHQLLPPNLELLKHLLVIAQMFHSATSNFNFYIHVVA